MRRKLRFAGPCTNEPLIPGRHVTLRPWNQNWQDAMGAYVFIEDMESGRKGMCLIREVVGPLTLDDITELGYVEGERSCYNTGTKLVEGLTRFYGGEAKTMLFSAVEFLTFLAEVPELEDE